MGGGSLVSHSNVLIKDGSVLHVVATTNRTSKSYAENHYTSLYTNSNKSGAIECSDLTSITDDEKINTVCIQCSGNQDDELTFDIPWMNATIYWE